jgi:predicted DNA-binding transcriptional regulator YafY
MNLARADRLFRLQSAIRALPHPVTVTVTVTVTAARLAEETGVSRRTLCRDIDALRAGGALIDDAAGLCYYTLTEDLALPPQMFSQLEVEALALGLAEVRHMGDPALAKAAMAKITATLPERVQRQAVHAVSRSIRFIARTPAPAHVALLREASWQEREVQMLYMDLNGVPTERRVRPLSIVYFANSLMLLAWCLLRQDFRRFHLDRMDDFGITEISFRPRRVGLLRDYVSEIRHIAPV